MLSWWLPSRCLSDGSRVFFFLSDAEIVLQYRYMHRARPTFTREVLMDLPDMVAEDAAHRLLARAVELDAHRSGSLSIDQLRDVARDAGISPRAFEDALAEMRAGEPKRSWRSWLRYGAANALGVGAFW